MHLFVSAGCRHTLNQNLQIFDTVKYLYFTSVGNVTTVATSDSDVHVISLWLDFLTGPQPQHGLVL